MKAFYRWSCKVGKFVPHLQQYVIRNLLLDPDIERSGANKSIDMKNYRPFKGLTKEFFPTDFVFCKRPNPSQCQAPRPRVGVFADVVLAPGLLESLPLAL